VFFYFSLPQTLLRQLAALGKVAGEYKYVFVPEAQHSKSGRDNKANLEISREILLSTLNASDLLVSVPTNPLNVTHLDGIGDELLRGVPVYGREAPSTCDYIVQHSCLGWEGMNLRAFVRPDLITRAVKRTLKRYKRTNFSKLWMYTGTSDLSLRQTRDVSQRVSTITHFQLANICRMIDQNSSFFSGVPRGDSLERKSILFLPTGRCQNSFNQVLELAQREKCTVYIKTHPQQTASFKIDFFALRSRVVLVSDESVPVELLIQRLAPRWIIGPRSSIEYFCEAEYLVYEPEYWQQEQEASLLDKYRRILTGKKPIRLDKSFL